VAATKNTRVTQEEYGMARAERVGHPIPCRQSCSFPLFNVITENDISFLEEFLSTHTLTNIYIHGPLKLIARQSTIAMVQTTASVATQGSVPAVIPHEDDQYHYVSLVRASNFQKQQSTSEKWRFWWSHGTCDDAESSVVDAKKIRY